MFLNYIKEITLKKILKNRLQEVQNSNSLTTIKSVGLLVDESYFFKKIELIDNFVQLGFKKENISVLVFKDKINANDVFSFPTFNNKHINISGNFTEKLIVDFTEQKFDLLINYYNLEIPTLLLITNKSKADFKVGFSDIDKKLNHFSINTGIDDYKIFASELFKYLKILKKI